MASFDKVLEGSEMTLNYRTMVERYPNLKGRGWRLDSSL
jgi:hypothetical protein